jgi:hypothetical protein
VEEDGIEISWSPPASHSHGANLSYTVAYASRLGGASRTTVTTTGSLSWRIRAELGDEYTVTVRASAESGEGEGSTISAKVDYKSFQIRVDGVGQCGELLDKDPELKLSFVVSQLEQALGSLCFCDAQIGNTEFHCQADNWDFVIIRGLIFSPVANTSDDLLSLMEKWVTSGPTLTIAQYSSISTDCRPQEMYSQSPGCVLTDTSTPSTEPLAMNQESVEKLPVAALVGVGAGAFFVGVLLTSVVFLVCYMIRKQQADKTGMLLQRRARILMNSRDCEENSRYVSSDGRLAKPQQRDLPLIPLCATGNDALTLTNPATKEGVSMQNGTKDIETYETIPAKVPNPMYAVMDGEKPRTKEHQLTAAVYEEVSLVSAQAKKKSEDEYILMLPVLSQTDDSS